MSPLLSTVNIPVCRKKEKKSAVKKRKVDSECWAYRAKWTAGYVSTRWRRKQNDWSVRTLFKSATSVTIFLKGKTKQHNVPPACRLSKKMHVYTEIYYSVVGKQFKSYLCSQDSKSQQTVQWRGVFKLLYVWDIFWSPVSLIPYSHLQQRAKMTNKDCSATNWIPFFTITLDLFEGRVQHFGEYPWKINITLISVC